MEPTKAILLLNNDAEIGEELQPSLHISGHNFKVAHKELLDTTKLADTENKLTRVFEEYSSRIEGFMLMLDTLKEGVIIINKAAEIRYTNEFGNTLLQAPALASEITPHLTYHHLNAEQKVSLTTGLNTLEICINNFFWNGEACNIFTINKKEIVLKQEAAQVDLIPVAATGSALAEPFEAMLNYLQLIASHQANGKAAEAAQCAELAAASIVQSEQLLNDIKSYISLTNYKPVLAPVAMQKIVGDVLKAMGPQIEEAGIEITVSDLPETTADKDLILKLVKHLVHNALKFRNKNRKAIIDIGHDKNEGQFIFCVRDNGIGISKKHHEEIFNLFSTLNNGDEYEGHGTGLAICKQIVALHGGKIWVESLPGHGSNFYFKLHASTK